MKKRHKKEVDFERELKGPYAYDRFDNISKICQYRYLLLIKLQSLILIIISLLSSFSSVSDYYEEYLRYFIVSLSIVILAMIIFLQNKNYMKGWQNARFIAESVLSNSWLFSFKIGIYNNNEKAAAKNILDIIDKIEKDIDLNDFLSIYDSHFPPIAEWMKNLFNEPSVSTKKAYYIKHRLDNQINWYNKKSHLNMKRSSRWYTFSLILLSAGIILTMLVGLNHFSVLGFISTIIAAILIWRQTRRFDELKITYAVAAKELNSLRAKFELEDDELDILKFVEEAEKSISREHKLWFNWTNIS